MDHHEFDEFEPQFFPEAYSLFSQTMGPKGTGCTEETTVEEKGKVYMVLGESVGTSVGPAQEGPEEPEPVTDATYSPRENRKRPLPEETPNTLTSSSLPSPSPPSQTVAPLSSTPPSRPSAAIPTEMDYLDMEEEHPLHISSIDFLPNDQPTVLREKEYREETTVEEKGKVYAGLGESAGTIEDPAQEGRDDVSEEDDEEEERICRWNACGKRFMGQHEFVNHVRGAHMEEHANRLLRKCPWEGCSRTEPFSRYQSVKTHVQSHMKYKPFVCTEPKCNKAYFRKSDLNNHRNVHTGEKPFMCYVCKKIFTDSSNFSSHEKQVHGHEKQYKCDVEACGKSFTDPSSLRRHFRTHHPELYQEFEAGKHRVHLRRGEEEQ